MADSMKTTAFQRMKGFSKEVLPVWRAVYLSEFRTQLPNLIGLAVLMHFTLLLGLVLLAIDMRREAVSETILGPYWNEWLSPYNTGLVWAGLFVMWIGLDLFAKDWREKTAVFLRSLPMDDRENVTAKLGAGFSVIVIAAFLSIPLHALGAWMLDGDVSFWEPLVALPPALVLLLPWFLAGAVLSCHMQRPSLLILCTIAIWLGVTLNLANGLLKEVGYYLNGTDTIRLVLIHLFVALGFGAWIIRTNRYRQIAR